jgi:hypothetical protein
LEISNFNSKFSGLKTGLALWTRAPAQSQRRARHVRALPCAVGTTPEFMPRRAAPSEGSTSPCAPRSRTYSFCQNRRHAPAVHGVATTPNPHTPPAVLRRAAQVEAVPSNSCFSLPLKASTGAPSREKAAIGVHRQATAAATPWSPPCQAPLSGLLPRHLSSLLAAPTPRQAPPHPSAPPPHSIPPEPRLPRPPPPGTAVAA